MDVALVKHPQHDVNSHNRGENKVRFGRKRILKGSRGSLETRLNARREMNVLLRLLYRLRSFSQRNSGGQIEGKRYHRELSLMVHCEGGIDGVEVTEGSQRNLS